jgi:hypothetical protein
MLPSRLRNAPKCNTTIQMALIKEADSEYDQQEKEMSPTRKTKLRNELLTNLENQFPVKQFAVTLVCFCVYEC